MASATERPRQETKCIREVAELSYRERTAAIDLLTLEKRKREDEITTFKFLNRFDECRP